jgi:hypothetical protein
VLEGGDEGEADGLAVLDDLRGVGPLGGDEGVGNRRHPYGFGPGGSEERFHRGRGRAHPHGHGPTLDLAVHVDADVGGDAVEPPTDARTTLEALGVAPGPQHRLLDGVLGFETGAEHAVAVPGELASPRLQIGQDRRDLAQGGHL